MGRSKFPGKPSKHVNKKRVNVLPPTSQGIIECNNPVTVETVPENKQVNDGEKEKEESEEPSDGALTSKLPLRKRRLSRQISGTKSRLATATTKRSILTKLRSKSGSCKMTKMNHKARIKPGSNLVGKFVLPTRSVHSSRVIKPNKRFINMDLSDTITLKKRVKPKREVVKSENNEETTPGKFINGRVVLRQARLKLHSQPLKGSEGPFSSAAGSGTVTCGVCGTVRFYRFVKQARKFNIYSCESCRKFISKMIKRQSCGKNAKVTALVCHKGQGMCHVPPFGKLLRCGYRARCSACWLKMCLRSFQMPLSLKHGLLQLLPKNMVSGDMVFNSSLPIMWQLPPKTMNQRPVRVAAAKPSQPTAPTDIKRQKVDLKGPRVKHVCRSASIVLGQPLATFPIKDTEKKAQVVVEDVQCKTPTPTIEETELSDGDKFTKVPIAFNETLSQLKRERNSRVPLASMPSLPYSFFSTPCDNKPADKKPMPDLPNSIVLDFWENSDLEDINQNGFCLMSSQQFPMPAICYLCGSAGRETLLHCSLCCEPYHPYCLEQSPRIFNNSKDSIWLCPRCTICTECNLTDREKYNCTKCLKPYHLECFNQNWNDKTKRPSVCYKCLVCLDCGDISTKFFGMVPLCAVCFKLRKRNTQCMTCHNNTEEINNDKMIGCSKCKKWHHIKCTELSEECYYILSELSSSVKFLCHECSKQSSSSCRKVVESELRNNMKLTLQLFSKNKLVKNLLRLSKLCEIDSDSRTVKILEIKRKLRSNRYSSVSDFNTDIEILLSLYQSDELLTIYRTIFKSVFPWFSCLRSLNASENAQNGLKPPTEDEIIEQIECVSIDSRYCSFCKSIGDGLSHLESRLLYFRLNEWFHINCALWSSEVYEEIDGSLHNVAVALLRAKQTQCAYCKQKGASVGCAFKGCCEVFHFICARTAKCHFLHDKIVYCCTHELPKNASVITTPNDFNIKRTVFLDSSDCKKDQYSLIEKVNVMVGSLSVANLGKITPVLSDNAESLIPTGYICSRLFWSTVEPWKLVPYKISTTVLNANVNQLQVEKSFTVDHSLPKPVVERKLKEILVWLKDIDKKKSDIIEFDDDEEPQNGADLLSPEITDAIFEELPHELLDGISVQDIFPKLMSYEDFVNIDCRNDENSNDAKKLDDESDGKTKGAQRACSLTLSCKLDNSFAPVIKKRKMAPRENNLFFQLLQVDGNFDDSGSDGEAHEDTWVGPDEPVTCERCQCTYRTQASYTRHLDSCELICSSESDSEMQEHDSFNVESSNMQVNLTDRSINDDVQQPVITSFKSFQNEVHTSVLNRTQTFVSKSTSEFITVPQGSIISDVSVPEMTSETYTVRQAISVNEPQYCLNSGVSLCMNPPIAIQPLNTNLTGLEFQPAPIAIQPLPLINVAPQNPNIISSVINVPSNRWVKPSPKKVIRRTIATKCTNDDIIPQNGVILQSLPSTNFVPFMENFQQNPGQNVHYVTTFPQITTPQPLMHFPENNLISLMPGIQPTMIIQQPRVLENQLIVDSNGSLSWGPQVQSMYYGFETIVQNTVMQSQQFLPSTVPGVLTANSSYSTTTQVFQTSKLEPMLDVAANSYVLVNPAPIVEVPSSAPVAPPIVQTPEVKFTPTQKATQTPILPPPPLQPEQRIPTNIVTPIPKLPPPQSRPMSRVLPMPTVKETKAKVIPPELEQKEVVIEEIQEFEKKPKTEFPKPEPYKNFNNRTSPVQIAPLKPIKSQPAKPQILAISDKPNRQEKLEKKLQLVEPPKPLTPEKKETENNAPTILYTIETQDGYKYTSSSIADLWTKVFETVQNARLAHNMPLLPHQSGNLISSLQMMGLKTSGLKYLLEQLPGATKCTKYKPTFTFPFKSGDIDEDLIGHSNGAVRCSPLFKKKEPYDMFGWLASNHRKPEHSLLCSELVPRRGSANNLPMAMRFRQLKLTSKYSVGVYRSKIHRRGLFCLRDFEAGEMVIEYAGEVIRSILTDKREKFYNSKGIGCYMFRIDDNLVVDATMKGNAARFINHSCDPNCYSKVVEILGHKHIIIFALRRIICGEELTYDYKFPIEEDKILCTCGARRCRKFLN